MKYKVPFVNYSLQYKNLEKEIDGAIKKVLSEGQLILRDDVERFEKQLAEFLGVKYVVSVNSGTDALIFALKSAGVGPGDEVITVSHTFFASIEAIVHNGAKPVLVDVREDFLIDPNQIEERITKNTKAIILVHYNGRTCEMDRIMEIAKKHNLFVIEDSAQALGAMYNNKKAGSFGIAGCFSFYPAKILGTAGDGGAVCTNDEKIAEKVRLLRGHGIKGKTEIILYGFTSRLDNLQAAILNIKLPYLDGWITRRREIAKRYQEGLGDLKEAKTPPPPEETLNFDVYQNYVLKAKKRNELYNYLKEQSVETLIKDPVANHKHQGLGLEHFSLPYTEQLANEVISLPMYPELTNEQADYVVKAVKDFYS